MSYLAKQGFSHGVSRDQWEMGSWDVFTESIQIWGEGQEVRSGLLMGGITACL